MEEAGGGGERKAPGIFCPILREPMPENTKYKMDKESFYL